MHSHVCSMNSSVLLGNFAWLNVCVCGMRMSLAIAMAEGKKIDIIFFFLFNKECSKCDALECMNVCDICEYWMCLAALHLFHCAHRDRRKRQQRKFINPFISALCSSVQFYLKFKVRIAFFLRCHFTDAPMWYRCNSDSDNAIGKNSVVVYLLQSLRWIYILEYWLQQTYNRNCIFSYRFLLPFLLLHVFLILFPVSSLSNCWYLCMFCSLLILYILLINGLKPTVWANNIQKKFHMQMKEEKKMYQWKTLFQCVSFSIYCKPNDYKFMCACDRYMATLGIVNVIYWHVTISHMHAYHTQPMYHGMVLNYFWVTNVGWM